jgi:RNA polymerase sigma-70 factor (ECF subfamily)
MRGGVEGGGAVPRTPARALPRSDAERQAEVDLLEQLRARLRGSPVPAPPMPDPVPELPAEESGPPAEVDTPLGRADLRSLPSEVLASQSAAGCAYSWETLYQRSYPLLLGYAINLGWGQDDAEDLAQETLVRAWENRDTFNPAYKFGPWVQKILANLSVDRKRRGGSWKGVQHRIEDESGQAPWRSVTFGNTEREVERAHLARKIAPILDEMGADDRELLLRVHAGGERMVDIAEEKGVKSATVRGRTMQARLRFARLYQERYGAPPSFA